MCLCEYVLLYWSDSTKWVGFVSPRRVARGVIMKNVKRREIVYSRQFSISSVRTYLNRAYCTFSWYLSIFQNFRVFIVHVNLEQNYQNARRISKFYSFPGPTVYRDQIVFLVDLKKNLF